MAANQQFNYFMPYHPTISPPFFLSNFFDFGNNLNSFFYAVENEALFQVVPIWDPTENLSFAENSQLKEAETGNGEYTATVVDRNEIEKKKPKRTQPPRFRPTKNNESNISNQAFSFMTTEAKSKTILRNFYKCSIKTDLFYKFTKSMISHRKKYMSKSTLLKLCSLDEELINLEDIKNVENNKALNLEEYKNGVAFLIVFFLSQKSVSNILTNQKIVSGLKRDHLTKAREICEFLKLNLQNRHSTTPKL